MELFCDNPHVSQNIIRCQGDKHTILCADTARRWAMAKNGRLREWNLASSHLLYGFVRVKIKVLSSVNSGDRHDFGIQTPSFS
jgi:hypothetical protein